MEKLAELRLLQEQSAVLDRMEKERVEQQARRVCNSSAAAGATDFAAAPSHSEKQTSRNEESTAPHPNFPLNAPSRWQASKRRRDDESTMRSPPRRPESVVARHNSASVSPLGASQSPKRKNVSFAGAEMKKPPLPPAVDHVGAQPRPDNANRNPAFRNNFLALKRKREQMFAGTYLGGSLMTAPGANDAQSTDELSAKLCKVDRDTTLSKNVMGKREAEPTHAENLSSEDGRESLSREGSEAAQHCSAGPTLLDPPSSSTASSVEENVRNATTSSLKMAAARAPATLVAAAAKETQSVRDIAASVMRHGGSPDNDNMNLRTHQGIDSTKGLEKEVEVNSEDSRKPYDRADAAAAQQKSQDPSALHGQLPSSNPSSALPWNGCDPLWEDSDDDVKPYFPVKQPKRKTKTAATKKQQDTSAFHDGAATSTSAGATSLRATGSQMNVVAATNDPSPFGSRGAEENPIIPRPSSPLMCLDDDECSSDALKPHFETPFFEAIDPKPLELVNDEDSYHVPASISRYLFDFQVAGVEFMFHALTRTGGGAILGDDMGLGKTVQMIALLSALLKKNGDGRDLLEVKSRHSQAKTLQSENARERGRALDEGRGPCIAAESLVDMRRWSPVLIVVPPSVVEHWKGDLSRWGHFSCAILATAVEQKDSAVDRVLMRECEILLCSRSLFAEDSTLPSLMKLEWKLIVVDEFHTFKSEKGRLATNLRRLTSHSHARVAGLTGTLMQNNHEELWNLLDLARPGVVGDKKHFIATIGNPIKNAEAKTATVCAKRIAKEKRKELQELMDTFFIKRDKKEVLGDDLPTKSEYLVMCELSEAQKEVYQRLLQLPDFVILKEATGPCECGVNQRFFQEYKMLSSPERRIEYMRQHKDALTRKCECCYRTPRDDNSPDGIDPRAVLWRQVDHDHKPAKQVAGDKSVLRCPWCISFPAMSILYKVCSHLSLLQAPKSPESCEGTAEWVAARQALEKATVFLPESVASLLPGGGYIRQTPSVLDDPYIPSGKMKVLDKLLEHIFMHNGRVLLFATSTQSLDLIQSFVHSRYQYRYLRMDGSTSAKKRVALVQKFKSDPKQFVFLLSTKAMGLGLNLTEANNAILWDLNWNPAVDNQSQDRCYRLGQTKNVQVFRLVTRGSIEELMYLRQLYKMQLTSATIEDKSEELPMERRFRGVAGEKERKGELFGLANLLKFTDGTFWNYGKTAAATAKICGVKAYLTNDILERGIAEDLYNVATGNDDGLARIESALKKCDAGDSVTAQESVAMHDGGGDLDEALELGGESQVNIGIFERAPWSENVATNLPPVHEGERSVSETDARADCHSEGLLPESPTPLAEHEDVELLEDVGEQRWMQPAVMVIANEPVAGEEDVDNQWTSAVHVMQRVAANCVPVPAPQLEVKVMSSELGEGPSTCATQHGAPTKVSSSPRLPRKTVRKEKQKATGFSLHMPGK